MTTPLDRVRTLHAQGMVAAHIIRTTGLRERTVFKLLAKIDRDNALEARRAPMLARRAEREAEKLAHRTELVARRAEREAFKARRRDKLAARRATLAIPGSQHGLRDRQQAQILADGQRALKLISQGLKPRDALVLIGGSRARMYRAMNIALALAPSDSLLT